MMTGVLCPYMMMVAIATAMVAGNKTSADGPSSNSWISDLFYRAVVDFAVREVGTVACRRQTHMYEQGLRNYTPRAVRMAESWDRRPIGVLGGNKYHLGVYDECVDIDYPVRGMYCIPEVKITAATKQNDYSFNRTEDLNDFGNNHSSWRTILGVRILHCFMYLRSFFILLVVICCCATFHHFITLSYYQNDTRTSEVPSPVFYAFSFIASGKELLKFDKNNELNIINGFKVLTMFGILFGHRAMFLMGYPMSYTKIGEKIYLDGPKIVLTSMNLVDPFFLFSGYLMNLSIYPVILNGRSVWTTFLLPILYRVVRILPAYCAVIAITAHVMPHYGDGPLWPQKTWHEAENCKDYWWATLLFINNFINVDKQCLLISWYISCDIQFFVVGIIVVYVHSKNNKYGIALLSLILGLSLFVPFIVTFLKKYDGIVLMHFPFLENPRSSVTFNESYRPSYMRAVPFFVGVSLGFVIPKFKEKKIRFSQFTVIFGTFITAVVCLYIQFYGVVFYKRQRPFYPIEQALYSTASHCTWTALSSVIGIFHFTSGYGLLIKLSSNRFVVPMGRLSYSVFLVNLNVMLMSQSTQRLPNYVSYETLFKLVIQDILKCYIMAVLLHLVVEAPFGELTRSLFRRGPKKCSFASPPDSNEILHKQIINDYVESSTNVEISHI